MGCCKKVSIVLVVLAAFAAYKIQKCFKPPPIPELDHYAWWGNGDPAKEDKTVQPFKINVSDEDLKDLKYRLENTRPFKPPLEGIQNQYGFNTILLGDILEYWKSKYDWRQREKFLNQFPQFTTSVQGIKIHFIHVKPQNVPKNVKVLPLLMIHGWPGSLREFYEIIPILTTPKEGRSFVFEVIAPHIPGYGFSEPAVRPGLGAAQVSVVMKNLMNRLGFEKFYGQGGDFGAIILQHLSVLYKDSVLGFHSNMCYIISTPLAWTKLILGSWFPSFVVKPEHTDRVYPLTGLVSRLIRETGYLHLQATKPDTIGVAMGESPIGLAAYILEKFIVGTNHGYLERADGGLKDQYTYDQILDNVMIYWWSKSATTSFRLYAETFSPAHFALKISSIPIQVPTACARFKYDFYSPDAVIKDIFQNLVQLNDYDGGHFAAIENPKILAKDVFSAIEKMEKLSH